MEQNTMGQRIKSRRKELKMTQTQLGASLNPPVKTSTISGYETGYSIPDAKTIAEIAAALRCTSDYLLGVDTAAKIHEKEAFAVMDFIREMGYKVYSVDNEIEEVGKDTDGTPIFSAINERIGIEDLYNKKKYIVFLKDWEEMKKRILSFGKFEISEFLKTKEPEKE